MTTRQTKFLVNINRALIFALTLIGLFMDGYQPSDTPITLAVMVWLWLSVFVRFEARILNCGRRLASTHATREINTKN